jgi:hypothetical protein
MIRFLLSIARDSAAPILSVLAGGALVLTAWLISQQF